MQQDYISFRDTGCFSKLICDYLDKKQDVNSFYNHFPSIENFKRQILEKQKKTTSASREILVSVLKKQYKEVEASNVTIQNIEQLRNKTTFTITTGHQLNLFTGPLYFLYKIVSTINLTKTLKEQYPKYNFVPVYWMATEDHDFEEINYFNFKGKKVQWNKEEAKGVVGELSTDGLQDVFNVFLKELGQTKNAQDLEELFKSAYVKHENLASATRFLANQLFKDYGLVIVDANERALKKQFIPYIKDELLNQTSYKSVSETNKSLSKTYDIQVNPRKINLFYINDKIRERIVFKDDLYKVLNTKISWTRDELINYIEKSPEQFSPNVIMRPLYQEVILPNLCYIGGGGEIAYWFQLKRYFNNLNIPFPVLLLRNSVLIQTKKQQKKLENLNISKRDIFLDRNVLINKRVREISNIDIDFSPQKKHLKQQFKSLYELAEKTDKSFLGAVKAQETKQISGLEHLEKRLLKAQKRKLSDEIFRMSEIQNELFPNQNLQERNVNFSEFYLEYGEKLIPNLIASLNPLDKEFSILTF